MKRSSKILISAAITLAIAFVLFYIFLPPLNIFSKSFWIFLIVLAIIFGITEMIIGKKGTKTESFKTPFGKVKKISSMNISKYVVIAAAVPLAVLIIGGIVSSTFFNAHKYASVITVKDAVFEEDMPENDTVTNIALMDTASATIIGNRTLGALSHVVSQYELGTDYSQINYKGAPQKVANLEYAGFFKWFNNRKNGIPGFVMVDPVNISAEYKELSTPMKYVDSAYFGEDLYRKLRFSYPTKIFDSVSFEIDENGTPYYIVACVSPKVGLFGAYDVSEVIIFNPCDGSSTISDVSEAPAWVDIIYTGTLACEKYDWYGTLSGGFWNSVIGNKDCKITTDDFGYIVIGDDVWYFTGVTSVVSDRSNIGFIISNARTGEYKFYSIVGAEEYSAMAAAEGEVQEKGYDASFPSLINVEGKATYIMVLKDEGGLVKLYALVNVENYSIVATGATQTEAKTAYIELMKQNGIISGDVLPDNSDNYKTADITVSDVRLAAVNQETVVYITADDGTLYKRRLAEDESLMLIRSGDRLQIKYTDTANDRIKQIAEWSALAE